MQTQEEETRRRFQETFARLSLKTGRCIVAESEPIGFDVAKLDAIDLPSRDRLDGDVSELALIATVADAFDYDILLSDTVVLLTKRFSRAGDLPDMTFDECEKALANVSAAIFRLYSTGSTMEQDLIALTSSVSEAQLKQLSLGLGTFHSMAQVGGMNVTAFNEEQRRLIWRLAANPSLGIPLTIIGYTRSLLRHIRQSGSSLGWSSISTGSLRYGVEIPRSGRASSHFSLDQKPLSATGAGGWTYVVLEDVPVAGDIDRSVKQRSATRHPDPADGMTLQDCLNANFADSAKCAVSGDLGGKRVSAFGVEKMTADTFLQASARLFGLDISTRFDGTTYLQIHSARPAPTITDLAAAVLASLPVSLARYTDAVGKQMLDKPVNPRLARFREGRPARSDKKAEMRYVASALHAAAIKEIYSRISPDPDATDQRLPFDELNPPEQNLLGLAYFASSLDSIAALGDTPPRYLVDFENGVVHAGTLPGRANDSDRLAFDFVTPGEQPGSFAHMSLSVGFEPGTSAP